MMQKALRTAYYRASPIFARADENGEPCALIGDDLVFYVHPDNLEALRQEMRLSGFVLQKMRGEAVA